MKSKALLKLMDKYDGCPECGSRDFNINISSSIFMFKCEKCGYFTSEEGE